MPQLGYSGVAAGYRQPLATGNSGGGPTRDFVREHRLWMANLRGGLQTLAPASRTHAIAPPASLYRHTRTMAGN